MDATTGVRVLFAGQYWPGANSLYIANAFERCGAIIRWVNDTNFFPGWESKPGRIARRLMRPLIDMEWNRKLLAEVENFQPDLVYITHAEHLAPETVDAIHKKSIPVMCFYHDVIWQQRPGNRFAESIDRFDLVVTTRHWHIPEFKAAGAKEAIVVRFGYEPLVHRPLTITPKVNEAYYADVVFIGTKEAKRSEDLTQLVSKDFSYHFRLWGPQWGKLHPESPLLHYWQKRGVFEQEIPVIYAAAKVALHWVGWEPQGDNEALRKGDQHNSRTFQIAACGGAIMLAQRTDEHQQFFEEDVEAVFFDDVPELREKLAYWLEPARDAARLEMACAARERCLKEDYTYVPVVQRFLNHFGLAYVSNQNS
jgi:spore maturation protein CgeB